ncbi:hypothetical protein KVR01_007204 [Diaporthe batatas]|uniref:uncharacterized protein n=1 Tax=Diaporthe batatas TaxID=748121 RepID=UPI001D0445C4|nr:uncharacterized protein KVR01_007204 [Diaporthe batatas]KAG8162726.1 hypothetical protein KVR01_007204 [Diaporthe batatas]
METEHSLNFTDYRDDHSRRADCEKRSPPEFEGITEQQKNELKKSSPKKKPLEEQWFELWEVVFPGRQRPQSAVIRNYVEEMVPLLRDLWNDKKSEIISGVMEARDGPAVVDVGLIANIMSSVFDRFEAETARSSQGCHTEWPEARIGSPQHSAKIDSGLRGAESGFNFEDPFETQYLSQIGLLDI